ncbi:winged helix-turn-helix domain-containing protein [Metallosphaera sedula]|uniref:winged helix-turn-helix domain-containing protein n=1 Tax=Metallosphaera sedula TaxID=43687 RepID=UPI0020BD817A|nr:winged helix-turn-helix domain-containing protein [Metallosphaera sedula]
MSSLSRKRTTYDIIRDMLELSQHGIRKTNLMLSCRLSFDLLKKYLSILETHGLVKEEGRLIVITPKGSAVLQMLTRLDSLDREAKYLDKRLRELIPSTMDSHLKVSRTS